MHLRSPGHEHARLQSCGSVDKDMQHPHVGELGPHATLVHLCSQSHASCLGLAAGMPHYATSLEGNSAGRYMQKDPQTALPCSICTPKGEAEAFCLQDEVSSWEQRSISMTISSGFLQQVGLETSPGKGKS